MKEFFASGCHELDNKEIQKAKRVKKERTDYHKCRGCGFVLPEDADECPVCGMPRKRPRQGRTVVRPGKSVLFDEIDGSSFDGDYWNEICAVATKISPGDETRARKIALAKYKSIFNKWPRGEFRLVYREPDPEVAAMCNR